MFQEAVYAVPSCLEAVNLHGRQMSKINKAILNGENGSISHGRSNHARKDQYMRWVPQINMVHNACSREQRYDIAIEIWSLQFRNYAIKPLNRASQEPGKSPCSRLIDKKT